ncbi:MAG: sugar transferase [Lachnospiraceae bacterium]|nr:sugar transferase [Lachnospiraceae bacterium]
MRSSHRHANINIAYMCFDVLFGILAYIIASIIDKGKSFNNVDYLLVSASSILLTIVFNKNKRLYDTTLFFYIDRWLSYLTQSFILSNLFVTILAFYVGHCSVEFRFYLIFLISEYVLLIVSAFFTRWVLRRTKVYAVRTLLVGTKNDYEKVIRFLSHNSMSAEVIGYISETSAYPEGDDTPFLGTIDDLEEVVHKNSIDQVFFMQHRKNPVNLEKHVDLCLELGLVARVLVHPYRVGRAHSIICSIGTYPAVTYHNVVLNVYAKAAKRVFDVIFSIVGIIVSAIPMLITAIAIKLDSKGPVIFKQTRVGLNGRHFKMFKFRSMVQDAEAKKKELMEKNKVTGGLMFKMDNDPRITKVGKFIRKTSIDELPQFFNVLFGTMSLVGTRPPTVDEVAKYDTRHWRRLSVKPGITGMWQTSGRSEITNFEEVVALDKEYIDNWSMWLDIKILFKTVIQVFARKGAY